MTTQEIILSATASDSELAQAAWGAFCFAHPAEAHEHDPDGFWKYFQTIAPNVSREQMEKSFKEVMG